MRPIHQKALADITWAELDALVASAVAEGPNLEYKRTLADPNGGDDPWIKGQDRIGRAARDELAREIVAFANAYGGLLLLGVDEEKASGTAQALTPLPRCADLAERLQRAIGDIVDPPMPGFDCRAIPSPFGDGTGVIALRVSGSNAAPHGYGEPPQTYVRRGASATPMTMRDLQAVFWDARTRQERVKALRADHHNALQAMFDQIQEIGLPATERSNEVVAGTQHLVVGMQIIPQQSLDLRDLDASAHWLLNLCPGAGEMNATHVPAFERAGQHHGWTPYAHGVIAEQYGPAWWRIGDDGTISVVNVAQARDNLHFPGWYCVSAAIVIAMGERLRRRSGRPDIPLEFSCTFLHDGSAQATVERAFSRFPRPQKKIAVGPYLIAQRDHLPSIFASIEKQIWAGFSVPFVHSAGINFDNALQPGPWSR